VIVMGFQKANYRTRKTIVSTIEKLINTYGLETTRATINNFFFAKRMESKLQKELVVKEKEIQKIKSRLFK